MTGCLRGTAARKTRRTASSAVIGWCRRSPTGAWRTSSRTARRIRRGCGPHPPTWRCRVCSPNYSTKAARDQERILDGQRRLADAQARFGAGMTGSGQFPEHLVQVVADRARSADLSASLINTARKDWMTLENLDTEMPLTMDFAQPPLPAAGGQVRCRSIYAAAVIDDPVARRIVEACAEAGEQARLLPRRANEDEARRHQHAALLPLTPNGTAGALAGPGPADHGRAARVLRDCCGTGHPAQRRARDGPSGDGCQPAQQTVLALMAEGLHDDAIARAPASAPPRSAATSRRSCNASTSPARFAAGAAAQRSGWIG